MIPPRAEPDLYAQAAEVYQPLEARPKLPARPANHTPVTPAELEASLGHAQGHCADAGHDVGEGLCPSCAWPWGVERS